jgi:hypothetical protein
MSFEWPKERENAAKSVVSRSPTEKDFLGIQKWAPSSLLAALDALSDRVLEPIPFGELHALVRSNIESARVTCDDEQFGMLLCWTCAKALSKSPRIDTWASIKDMAYQSVELEHWIHDALLALAKTDDAGRVSLVTLAEEIFRKDDSDSPELKWNRTHRSRVDAREYWSRVTEKLDELWRGLQWFDLLFYREDFPLFNLLFKLDPEKFVQLMSSARNPDLVNSALLVTGAGRFGSSFSEWAYLAESAPRSFNDDGSWNGSCLAPLLLFSARNEILETKGVMYRTGRQLHASAVELEQEIGGAVQATIGSLSKRSDAVPMFMRWSTWLVRNLISSVEKDRTTPGSPEYLDLALLTAMGEYLRPLEPEADLPPDATEWETWCRLCVLSFYASNGMAHPPRSEVFTDAWQLSWEDWFGAQGAHTRLLASRFTFAKDEVPGLGPNLLAYPLANASDGLRVWRDTWDSAQVLREVVEFSVPGPAGGASGPYEGSKLLLLLFRVGLAVLDQCVSQLKDPDRGKVADIVAYYQLLVEIVDDMLETDGTLGRSEWVSARLHLIVRRVIWEDDSGREGIFSRGDSPSLSDYLDRARHDLVELLRIVEAVFANGRSEAKARRALDDARIDRSRMVDILRRLNELDARRYPVDENSLRRLLELRDENRENS